MAPIEFGCGLSETATPLTHFWEHMAGSEHAPLALRADWQTQLRLCHDELGFGYVRPPHTPSTPIEFPIHRTRSSVPICDVGSTNEAPLPAPVAGATIRRSR